MTALPATLDLPRRAVQSSRPPDLPPAIPRLVNGDRLSQPEFHRRYEAMPPDVRAELIGGIVYMASPMRMPHGQHTRVLSGVLSNYEDATPGVDGADNATAILSDDSEPQPDLILRLLPECGGQTRLDADQYLVGGPELIIEVAHSTTAIDLHRKREDYRAAGVREYLVFCIEERELRAFDLPADRSWPLPADGVFRSGVFPGLWIDALAVLARNSRKVHQTARKGLRSPEHSAFARRLGAMLAPRGTPASRRRRGKPKP
jgi:Uma2 family endonuclease